MESDAPVGRALVLIPGALNHFYNLNGRRIAEGLQDLGWDVEVATLATLPEGKFDWCVLVNITEVVLSCGTEQAGLGRLRKLRKRCKVMASCSIDCVRTSWYQRLEELCRAADVEVILDLGLVDQREFLPGKGKPTYHFMVSGLTSSEQQQLGKLAEADTDRNIPWTFIGHQTPERVALVDYLIRHVNPAGFVYLPTLAPYTEEGSPHLNQTQVDTVLARTRYQVWCSHHAHFYMEPERFRLSLLTGGVPIKVMASKLDVPDDVPFRYLLMRWEELGERLKEELFARVRRRFHADFQQMPSLASGLASFLSKAGMPVKKAPEPIKSPLIQTAPRQVA